jgi:myo-inositol-1-phosphate synthase
MFGNVPMDLELRLSVIDSPNSGGCAIDAIRCLKLAKDRGISGPLTSISSYTMKHPPIQYSDAQARIYVEEYIRGERER